MFRRKIPLKKSKRNFSKSANRSHAKNFRGAPMRGGIRL
ncbi:MAG: hypothetical protein [Microvirus sp.]|nr:MAG: hypothetical protein [Microvirus sp.]